MAGVVETLREAVGAVARLDDGGDEHEEELDAEAVATQCKQWGVTAELKPHQADGVAWLIGRYVRGVNVILGTHLFPIPSHTCTHFGTIIGRFILRLYLNMGFSGCFGIPHRSCIACLFVLVGTFLMGALLGGR